MINLIWDSIKSNIIYSIALVLLIGWFSYAGFTGNVYFAGSSVQHNAGYSGPVPHSGYGVRFYHK
jgi:hypothetical protein